MNHKERLELQRFLAWKNRKQWTAADHWLIGRDDSFAPLQRVRGKVNLGNGGYWLSQKDLEDAD